MSDDIQPAMSRDDWACWLDGLDLDAMSELTECPHADAAVLLHGRPFGFRWEDVHVLNALNETVEDSRFAAHIQSIASRIAALLPPEAT